MTEYSAGVLLVEDNLTDVALALRAFKQHNMAHHIQVLRDGVEALEFLLGTGAPKQHNAADAPRVVLLDLKLPLIGGLEVLRQLKANPRTHSIPVVVLTGSSEEDEIAECYRLGANSYIVKPINFERFSEIMHSFGIYWLQINTPPNTNDEAP
jgi:two-component system response regulator